MRNILGKRGHPARARSATSWTGARPLRQHAARRLYVLVFICIGSQRIEYVACTSDPDGAWMVQQPRNLLMGLDDRGP